MERTELEIDEIRGRIKYAIFLYWRDLKRNYQEYNDVIENVLTQVLEDRCFGKTSNIPALVRGEQRKYFNRIRHEIPFEEYLLGKGGILKPDTTNSLIDMELDESNLDELLKVWEIVPDLRLSEIQSEILSQFKRFFRVRGYKRGFESYYASMHGVSQAAISKDLKRALEKYRLSVSLIPGAFDAKNLLEEYGSDWSTSALRRRLWPLLKPGKQRNIALANLLKPYQNAFFEYSCEALTSFSNRPANDTALFCQGYNALILGTYIDTDNLGSVAIELNKKVASKSWLAGRVIARQSHLIFDKDKCSEYRDWLLDLYFKDEMAEEKEKYIGYMVGYFGGYDNEDTNRFILSKANYVPKKYDVDKLIKEHYQNISDPLYTRAPTLMEINFMRIALILSTVDGFDFEPSIKSCISQILNKTESVSNESRINRIISDFKKRNESE
jgi:hypothetical protein